MPLPPKSIRPAQEGGGVVKDSDESDTSSNNLWVGNLSPDVTDSDLMALFAQFGPLDSVTSYSSRSYGFVFFKRIEDAKAAKYALQGAFLRGNSIKIEFAKPVCSYLCSLLGLRSYLLCDYCYIFDFDSCIIIYMAKAYMVSRAISMFPMSDNFLNFNFHDNWGFFIQYLTPLHILSTATNLVYEDSALNQKFVERYLLIVNPCLGVDIGLADTGIYQ